MLDYPNQRELAILSHTLQLTIARIERGNNTALKLRAKLLLHLIKNLQLILDSSFTQYVQK